MLGKHIRYAYAPALIISLFLGACSSIGESKRAPSSRPSVSETFNTPEAQAQPSLPPSSSSKEIGSPAPTIKPTATTAADKLTGSALPPTEVSGGSGGTVMRDHGAIVVDHTDLEEFGSIPPEYIEAASQLRMIYVDRSVGKNIDDALDCLSYPSSTAAPNHCSRREHPQSEYEVDQAVVDWARSGGYDRSRWEFATWAGDNCAQWYEKVECFFDMMAGQIDRYDVASYQLSYLAVDPGSSINDEPGGYFWDNPDRTDVYDQIAYENQHPDTEFIYWTTSLARSIGSQESDLFNQRMRQFADANGKVLFDVADILSHDPDGKPCYDNRDGIKYDNGNRFEDYVDDGEVHLAICPQYTTEIDGGHLGSVAAGKIRVAKAFWVLMARIAGWDQ